MFPRDPNRYTRISEERIKPVEQEANRQRINRELAGGRGPASWKVTLLLALFLIVVIGGIIILGNFH